MITCYGCGRDTNRDSGLCRHCEPCLSRSPEISELRQNMGGWDFNVEELVLEYLEGGHCSASLAQACYSEEWETAEEMVEWIYEAMN